MGTSIRSIHRSVTVGPQEYPPVMKSISLVYFNVGGGHRSAALALDSVIRDLALPPGVRLVNLVRSPRSPGPIFGRDHRRQAGRVLQRAPGARLDLGPGHRNCSVLQALIRLSHKSLVDVSCAAHWGTTEPDLVVSHGARISTAPCTRPLMLADGECPLCDDSDRPGGHAAALSGSRPHQAQHLDLRDRDVRRRKRGPRAPDGARVHEDPRDDHPPGLSTGTCMLDRRAERC